MQILCSLVAALTCFSFVSTSDTAETVKVYAGEPFILNFGYTGPTLGVSHELTKDGEKVAVDNIRTFKQLGIMYFTETYELDSGSYHFTVTGNGADFEKTVILSG